MKLRILLSVVLFALLGCPDTGTVRKPDETMDSANTFKQITVEVQSQPTAQQLSYLRSRCKTGRLGDVVFDEMPVNIRIEGVGVVYGLNGRGTKNVPRGQNIRKDLLKSLVKEYSEPHMATNVLDSVDSAPVRVFAALPPFAAKGDKLDVQVQAFEQGVNLQGGILAESALEHMVRLPAGMTVDARFIRPGGWVSRGVQAYARGVVSLVSGVKDGKVGGGTVPHTGYLAAGAMVKNTHGLALRLRTPNSYEVLLGQRIISQRFRGCAHASNDRSIQIELPDEYTGNWKRFLSVIYELDTGQDVSDAGRRAEALISQLGVAQPRLRERAEFALEAIGNAGVRTILRSLRAARGVRRQALLRVLAHLNVPEVADELIAQTRGGNELERYEAAWLLSRFKEKKSADALIELLNDESGLVKSEAIRSLEKLAPKRRILPVEGYFSKEKNFVMNRCTSGGRKEVVIHTGPEIRRIDVFGETVNVTNGFRSSAGPFQISIVADRTEVVFKNRPDLKPLNMPSTDIRDIVYQLDVRGVTINDIMALIAEMDRTRKLDARVVWLE